MDILIVLLLSCCLPRGIPLIPIYFLLRNNSDFYNFHGFNNSSTFSQNKFFLLNNPLSQGSKTQNINTNTQNQTMNKLKYYNHEIIPNYIPPNRYRNINCSPRSINCHLNRASTNNKNTFANNNVLKKNKAFQKNEAKKTYDNIKDNNVYNIAANEEEQLITKLSSNPKYNSYKFIYSNEYMPLIDINNIPIDYFDINGIPFDYFDYDENNYKETDYDEINYDNIDCSNIDLEYNENFPIPSTEVELINSNANESNINKSNSNEKEIILKEISKPKLKELPIPNSEEKQLSKSKKVSIVNSKENPISDLIEKNFKGTTISTIINGFGIITGVVVLDFKEVIALKLESNTILFINKKYITNFY